MKTETKQLKDVYLLGTAQTLTLTPWDKENAEYWIVGPAIGHEAIKDHRIDLFFEMHKKEYWQNVKDKINDYVAKNPDTKIIMQEQTKEIKNSIKYPLKEIQDSVNNELLKVYFTSTVAYMIAYAIYKKYKNIYLYGCHMSCEEEEYSMQRSCCEAWLNYGLGKGINYWLPKASDIMHSKYLYGYDQQKGILLEMLNIKEGLENALKDYEAREKKAHDDRVLQEGGLILMKKLYRIFRK